MNTLFKDHIEQTFKGFVRGVEIDDQRIYLSLMYLSERVQQELEIQLTSDFVHAFWDEAVRFYSKNEEVSFNDIENIVNEAIEESATDYEARPAIYDDYAFQSTTDALWDMLSLRERGIAGLEVVDVPEKWGYAFFHEGTVARFILSNGNYVDLMPDPNTEISMVIKHRRKEDLLIEIKSIEDTREIIESNDKFEELLVGKDYYAEVVSAPSWVLKHSNHEDVSVIEDYEFLLTVIDHLIYNMDEELDVWMEVV